MVATCVFVSALCSLLRLELIIQLLFLPLLHFFDLVDHGADLEQLAVPLVVVEVEPQLRDLLADCLPAFVLEVFKFPARVMES